MINSIYLKIKSAKDGDLKGSATGRDKEGCIELLSVNHHVLSPRDTSTGLPYGKRRHHPIIITKLHDQTSPVFYKMLVQNTPVEEASLLFFGSLQQRSIGYAAGAERLLYSIIIKKGAICHVEMKPRYPDERGKPGVELIEQVEIVYNEISWEWKEGKVATEDSWQNSV